MPPPVATCRSSLYWRGPPASSEQAWASEEADVEGSISRESIPRLCAYSLLSACLALIVVSAGWIAGHPAVADASPSHGVTDDRSRRRLPDQISLTRAQRSAGSVPADFKATSVTFVSEDETFVLGTAPGYGTLLLRSLDRGRSWVRLAAPSVLWDARLERQGRLGRPFASPAHGFVFGDGLWETTDGGRHWSRDSAAQRLDPLPGDDRRTAAGADCEG